MRTLWGREFRVVPEGLSEVDVVAFVEELMVQYRQETDRLEHVDALRELANRTVDEAQKIAAELREEVKREEASRISLAEEKAEKLLIEARTSAERLLDESKADSAVRIDESVAEAVDRARVILREAENVATRRAEAIVAEAEAEARDIMERARKAARVLVDMSGGLDGSPREDEPEPAEPVEAAKPRTKTPRRHVRARRKGPRPVFRWKPVPGATRYGLYVTQPPHGRANVVFKREDITSTTVALPVDLQQGVPYQWTIRAGNSSGWGPFAPYKRLPE